MDINGIGYFLLSTINRSHEGLENQFIDYYFSSYF